MSARSRPSSGIEVVDPDGERFYVSRKTAKWLEDTGHAKWTCPQRMVLLFEARELRVSGVNLQLLPIVDRRKRGGKTSVHVRLPADRRPTPVSQR
jgi:hypothetical protein